MKRLLFMIAIGLLVIGTDSMAQALNAGRIRFTLDGSAVGTLSLPSGATPGTYTWELPAQSGTLSLGGVTGWEVGGQALLPTNPGLLGSSDNADVSLIANGATLLTLDASDAAVLIPPAAQLRLGALNGGNWSAIESPDDITPDGVNPGNITYVLPDNLPGGVDVRLKVQSISGNTVTLTYTNPNTTGSIGFKKSGAATPTQGNGANDYTNVEGMFFTLEPDAIYSFEAYLTVAGGNNDGAVLRFGEPYGLGLKGAYTAVPGVTVQYYIMTLTDGNPVVNGAPNGMTHDVDTPELAAGETFVLKGYIETTPAVTSGTTLQIVMRANQAANVTVTAKSSVQLITE